MPRLPSSSLARTLGKSSSRAPLSGTVLRVSGGAASVRLPDGSVVDIAMPGGAGYAPGSAVTVQWNAKEQPVIVGGRGAGSAGAARVVELNIAEGDTLEYSLPDGMVFSDYGSAALLNFFFNGSAMPSVGAFYIALMSRINSKADYAEITSASVSNIKRAGKARNTTEFPLVNTGREISNALAVGAGAAGAVDSFRTSGTGFASGFDAEGWGVWDAQIGGNFWFGAKFDAINGVVKRHVPAGNTFSIPAGGLRARFSAGGISDFEARNYLNVLFNGMALARTTYRVGLLMNAQGVEPSTSAFSNYKQATISRNLTTFPLITGKNIICAIDIGGDQGGTDISFLSSLNVARLTENIPIHGVGLHEGTNGTLCWVVPNTAEVIKTSPVAPLIPAKNLILKLS